MFAVWGWVGLSAPQTECPITIAREVKLSDVCCRSAGWVGSVDGQLWSCAWWLLPQLLSLWHTGLWHSPLDAGFLYLVGMEGGAEGCKGRGGLHFFWGWVVCVCVREGERERERERERVCVCVNSNSKTLFYKNCSLGSFKNLSNS